MNFCHMNKILQWTIVHAHHFCSVPTRGAGLAHAVSSASVSAFLWSSQTHPWFCEISGNTGISCLSHLVGNVLWHTQLDFWYSFLKILNAGFYNLSTFDLIKLGRRIKWEPNKFHDWSQTVDIFRNKNWVYPVVTKSILLLGHIPNI